MLESKNLERQVRRPERALRRPRPRRGPPGARRLRHPRGQVRARLQEPRRRRREHHQGAALPRRGLPRRATAGCRSIPPTCARSSSRSRPGTCRSDDEMVTKARARLFGSWEMNWLAYNFAHDVALPGATTRHGRASSCIRSARPRRAASTASIRTTSSTRSPRARSEPEGPRAGGPRSHARHAKLIAAAALLAVAAAGGAAEPLRPWKGGATPALVLRTPGGRRRRPREAQGQGGARELLGHVVRALRRGDAVARAPARAAGAARLRGARGEPGRDGRRACTAFVERTGLDLPILLDREKEVARAWKVRALPTTFVVDAKGRIRCYAEGELDTGAGARGGHRAAAAARAPVDRVAVTRDGRARIVDRLALDAEDERRELVAGLLPRPRRASPRSTSTTSSAARSMARSAGCPSTTRRAPRSRSSSEQRLEIAEAIGPGRQFVDLGAGDCCKAQGVAAVRRARRATSRWTSPIHEIAAALDAHGAGFPGAGDGRRGHGLLARAGPRRRARRRGPRSSSTPGRASATSRRPRRASFLARIRRHCVGAARQRRCSSAWTARRPKAAARRGLRRRARASPRRSTATCCGT